MTPVTHADRRQHGPGAQHALTETQIFLVLEVYHLSLINLK